MGGIKLGKILGFEISLDWSWLFIFALVVYTLASGFFPAGLKGYSTGVYWLMGFAAAILLFGSVLVHELSHSVVSRRYGNQVKGITLFLFGGVSQTSDEPKSAKEEFWMAIAGPVTSFVLAAAFYILGDLGRVLGTSEIVTAVFSYLAIINFILAVFNLVPGFPLDGGRVLRAGIWSATGDLKLATRYASYAGQFFGYVLMGIGFFSILGGRFMGGLWYIFIGWFLAGMARNSYQQVLVRQALSGVPVSQVMTSDVPSVSADMSLNTFVNEYLLRHDYSCYPVTRNDDVIGVIGIEEARRISPDMWESTTVGQVVHGISDAYEVSENDDAWNALAKLADDSVCRLLVLDGKHLKGTVGRDSVFRLVQTKMRLGM